METDIKRQRIGKIVGIASAYLIGIIFFMLTNPDNIPIPLLVLPFLWLFAVVFMSARLLLRRYVTASKKQINIVASLLACLLVLLFVFQSIHQLTIRDVFISFAIISIAGLYLLRADFIQ
jgi:hypothetical protein